MTMRKKGIKIVTKKMCVNKGGFTLLEVLVAVSILTIGLLGVAKMEIAGVKGNYFSRKTTVALKLAEQKMEDLLGRDYTADADLVDTDVTNNADLTSVNTVDHEENVTEAGQVAAAGFFHRIWNVADDDPISNNKTIVVMVTWRNDGHRVTLSCIKPL